MKKGREREEPIEVMMMRMKTLWMRVIWKRKSYWKGGDNGWVMNEEGRGMTQSERVHWMGQRIHRGARMMRKEITKRPWEERIE